MITLLYGSSGSAKTRSILERMKKDAENGIRSLLIVPEQETVTSERAALTLLPPSAQLTTEVLNFSRLANLVFRKYGGLSYHYADKSTKAFLMHKTVSEHLTSLCSFDGIPSPDASLSEWFLSAVSELKASAVTAPMLDRVATKLEEKDPLKNKLQDLSLVYTSYMGLLRDNGLDDGSDDLTKLKEKLKNHDFFSGMHVYIDSFTSYTKQELDIIAEIARSASELTVSIASSEPNSEALHLASVVDTEKQLREIARMVNGGKDPAVEILPESKREGSEAIALLSENLWKLETAKSLSFPDDVEKHVVLSVSKSVYDEAENAALRILSLVRSGYRYRDIAVIARDASALTGVLDFVFEKYDIPYFLSEKEDLISLPPVKLLLAALRVISFRFSASDVIALLKTGLLDVSPIDADYFEEYVTVWGISGSAFTRPGDWDMNSDGFKGYESKRGKEIRHAANRVKNTVIPPLVALSAALTSAVTIREETDALLSYLESLNLSDKLLQLSDEAQRMNRKKTADIYARLYPVLTDLIDKIARLSPEGSCEAVSPDELEGFVRILLRSTEIGTIPTTVDEVTVGSANMLRASNVRCAILLGLVEGKFPATVSDNGFFTAAERKVILEKELPLSQSYDFRSEDELLYVSRAVSLPSELLVLSTYTADADGTLLRPSLPFLRAKLLLGYSDETVTASSEVPLFDRILTSRLSLDYYPALKGTAAGEALRRLYREKGLYSGVLESADVPVSDTAASISEDYAKELFSDRMVLSQTQIEKFVNCHFSYYCRYVLGLRESEPAAFGALDSGNFIHCILERFFSDAVDEKGNFKKTYDRPAIEALADSIIEAYKNEILPASLRGAPSGRLSHLCDRLRELSIMMIENTLEEFSDSDFRPRYFELELGKSGSPSPLSFRLEDGTTVTIPGKIDRVDLYKPEKTTPDAETPLYVRVVDYKTGTKEFKLADLENGLNMQMLIYLFTLCNAPAFFRDELSEGETVEPAGAVYHSSAINALELTGFPDSSGVDVRSLAEKEFKRTGVLLKDENVLRAMSHSLDPLFLPGVKSQTEKGETPYLDKERFGLLKSEIKNSLSNTAKKIRSGKASAAPLVTGNNFKYTPCTYCKMQPICRRTQNDFRTAEAEETEKE